MENNPAKNIVRDKTWSLCAVLFSPYNP